MSIESPCVGVCRAITGICIGCFRTTDEIAFWSQYTDEEKEKVLERIEDRKDDYEEGFHYEY